MPRILLTGKNGQVGWELQRMLGALGEVIALGREEMNLANSDAIRARIREITPDIIVNAAAYTAVDKAESEPDLAMAINGTAPGIMAEEARRLGALLVHYSTDYVFDGAKTTPYTEEDTPNPLNVYGKTKLAGERAIQASGAPYLILRTSWVYSARGKNFLLTILRLAAERPELKVVGDQQGAPTWARDIAETTARVLDETKERSGLFHLSASGTTSWFSFATEILRISGQAIPVRSIPSSEYPSPAARPANSVLDNTKFMTSFGLELPAWQSSLKQCLAEYGHVHAA
ncbi:MAG TPA: dTDP-4-dehydrorhamnose reductase [Burkholderiales bacterium]|nr:dTDP-4-dehydrorhamnose reductase [Burkholderiales bacterium]